LTTGYAAWPFPGLTLAIKEHDRGTWEKESAKVVQRLQAATTALDRAASLAGGTPAAR
jgi:hypothetical protein